MDRNEVELKNYEMSEYCTLSKSDNAIEYYKKKKIPGFTGLYYKDETCFFAIYPSTKGPIIYYKGKEYLIHEGLDIRLERQGRNRRFEVEDYKIAINYVESKYVGFDNWSDEIDVDLFYMIEQRYKDPNFYDQFTLRAE